MVTAYFFATPLIDYHMMIETQASYETPQSYFYNRYSNHNRKG